MVNIGQNLVHVVVECPIKRGRGMHHLLGFDKEWAVYGQPK